MSREEVLAAIRADFVQYEPQTALFLELFPLVFGDRAVVSGTSRDERLWISEGGGKMVPIVPRELGLRICQELERARPSLDVFAAVCRRVFRTAVRPGMSDRSGEAGLWLDTGMEEFACRQCGHCCRNLDYSDQLTEADCDRWHALGRSDVLRKVHRIRQDDGTLVYRMWQRRAVGQSGSPCPWLHKVPSQNRWQCRIHDVRPEICRQYPGSRKHAEMTGCPGFRRYPKRG